MKSEQKVDIHSGQVQTHHWPGGNYPAIIREWNPRGFYDYPTYCACAPEFYINNEILSHLGVNGSVITNADEQGTQDFRDQLFAGAVLACEDMWMNLFATANPASTGEDCDAQLVAGVSPITQGDGTCPLTVPIDYAPEIGDSTYIVLNGSDWELIGVSPGTVAYALGLQTGNILVSINAYDLSTPAGALDAFSSLQAATSVI